MQNPLVDQVSRYKKTILERGGNMDVALVILYAWAVDDEPKPTLSQYIDRCFPSSTPPAPVTSDEVLEPLPPLHTGKIEYKIVAAGTNSDTHAGRTGFSKFTFTLAIDAEIVAGLNNLLHSRDPSHCLDNDNEDFNYTNGYELAWLSLAVPIDPTTADRQPVGSTTMFIIDIVKTTDGPGICHWLTRNGDPVEPREHPVHMSQIEGAKFRLVCPTICTEYEITLVAEDKVAK